MSQQKFIFNWVLEFFSTQIIELSVILYCPTKRYTGIQDVQDQVAE